MVMSMRVISWEEFLGQGGGEPLALTIGVFDGVHRGHQSLIQRICSGPYTPAVVTFSQHPLKTLNPSAGITDILSLEQKLRVLEDYGVQLTVLIDFSENFCKINGRDFITLMLDRHPVRMIALGGNFRCGYQLDTGTAEIRKLAEARGVELWIAPPVMDGEQPVSSSRIRQALAAGRITEAERLLGRKTQFR